MKDELVSIIVPAYNAEKTLARMIEAVLAQTYRSIELIVVDDGSKDNTIEVVRKYMVDKRVKMIMQANGGVSAARNAGIMSANGEYLMFFDADDDVRRTIVGQMLECAKRRRDSLVVCGKAFGEKSIMPKKGGLVDGNLRRHVVGSVLKNGLLYSPCNKIYQAEVLKKYSIWFDEKIKFGEDLIFNLEYLEHMSSIYYLKKALYIYEHSSDGSSATTAGVQRYRMAMLRALRRYLGDDVNKITNRVLLGMVKMRWDLSVRKTKYLGGGRG